MGSTRALQCRFGSRFAAFAALLVAVVALAEEPGVQFQMLSDLGFRSSKPIYAAIRSQDEWVALLNSRRRDSLTEISGSLPEIDFQQFTLLIASSGVKPNLGHSLAFVSVRKMDGAIAVSVLEVRPGSNCPTAQQLTYPRIAALIPRTNSHVEFAVTNVVRDCQKREELH